MGTRTLMDQGSDLAGSDHVITPTPPKQKDLPVFLRDIGRALEKRLSQQPDTSLHWVAVIGEDSVQAVPTKKWQYNEAMLQVGVVNGNSEGSLIYVHAQKDRYQPDSLVALFRIKMLCSAKAAFADAKIVYEFFESKEFLEMTGQA